LIADGEMTALCRERLAFAAKLAAEFEKTEALCDALPALDLLMPMRNVAPPRLAVRSIVRDLRVIDPERLRALPEPLRAQWQDNGWLAALEAHIASARNWRTLLAQEDAAPAQA
ncbi:MAG: SapC family protein, partial [Alphaproteobacteria bacterium]|nr:SapC family protein [Alphaproteobacteria bacterium]